jgi:hypothetical protein
MDPRDDGEVVIMIGIEGTDDDGRAYLVLADMNAAQMNAAGVRMPADYGATVHGTPGIIAQLQAADGEPVQLTPTGPTIPLSSDDSRSVVAWLFDNTSDTRVVTTEKESPAVIPTGDDQIVY